MKTKEPKELDLKKLLKWINEDPHKDATLIEEVPVSMHTLIRIKNGTYKPSQTMIKAIIEIIERK